MSKLKVIYEPKGKAKEYGNLALNLYTGCGHKCTYCYAPAMLRMNREEFYNNPQPRKNVIENLRKDAKVLGDRYRTKRELALNELAFMPTRPEVFLCFTTDPYQPINHEYQLTRQAIEILHENDIAVNILTKGRITDFDLLARRPDLSKVGVTITCSQKTWEPNAKNFDTRMRNIDIAMMHKIKTWISLEPILNPDMALFYIKLYHTRFVQLEYHKVTEFKLGKWNYDKRANDIDWKKFVNEAIELLEKLGCKYYIKEDLRKEI